MIYNQNMLLYGGLRTVPNRSGVYRLWIRNRSETVPIVLNSSEVLEVSGAIPNRSGEISGTVTVLQTPNNGIYVNLLLYLHITWQNQIYTLVAYSYFVKYNS